MLNFYLSLLDNDRDRDKLAYIYDKYYDLMIAVAVKYLKNRDDAGDIVHDAVLKIISHIDDIDLDNELSTKNFICIIVKCKALDHLRRESKILKQDLEEAEYMLGSEDDSPVKHIIDKEGYEKLVGYISGLSDTYRDVCLLKYINGFKEAKIAEILGLPPKTVNVRIFRGRQILKRMIMEDITSKKTG